MSMQKTVGVMFSFVFIIFGGLCGYSIALYTEGFYHSLSQMGRMTNFLSLILLGILLGLTVAPPFTRLALRAVDAFALSLQRLSVQEVLMGSAGLLFGLIIAFFVNLALRQIDFSSIPAVGTYVGPFLIVLSTIFLALMGAFFGSRLVFIHSFAELLESGAGQRNWGDQRFVVDTSVIIDGRLSEIVDTGFISGTLVVSRFVLDEVQAKADSPRESDRLRGKRALDLLDSLRAKMTIKVEQRPYPDLKTVDAKLVKLAQDLKSPLLTNDVNLQKVAALQNVKVLNINALAKAVKPIYLPGESLDIQITRPGKESGQGVGFLDDGTMVVVDNARKKVGREVECIVTSLVQTASGRMIFARYAGTPSTDANEEEKESETTQK
ncbi:MAG TPA: TRAM domain-containing protein [Phycisphaerales bacterium]|nr:TRAM domain-containing protein [Phycisphaerales bacterium]